jgi:hypothetical protein
MELPDFESLKCMAEQNPEELERLRLRYCRELIDNAPERFRRKLSGLLFRIDMESRLSRNSIQRCVRLSQMMMDSFSELQSALNFSSADELPGQDKPVYNDDNVIPFPPRHS